MANKKKPLDMPLWTLRAADREMRSIMLGGYLMTNTPSKMHFDGPMF